MATDSSRDESCTATVANAQTSPDFVSSLQSKSVTPTPYSAHLNLETTEKV